MAAGLAEDAQLSATDLRSTEPHRQVTGLRSRWLHRRCDVCGHSFRVGDEVLVFPGGRAVHDMAGLQCAGNAVQSGDEPQGAATTAAGTFYDGLITAWPIPNDLPLHRLEPGHWLLAPPRRGHRRAACGVCGHNFLPLDLVVVCPCDPFKPRCRAAVHRDVLKQLHCWDLWQRSTTRQGSCLGMS